MIKNAVAYVFRKRTRTALIFLILTLILAVIYAGFSIMKTSEKMAGVISNANDLGLKIRSLKSETFNAESLESVGKELGAEKIFQYEGVAEIKNGEVVTGEQMVMREDLPGYLGNAVMLQAISNVGKDPLFRSEVFKVIEGKNTAREETGKVLVHEALAKKNQWKIGDKVNLKVLGEEKELELLIQGIFSGKKQEKYTGMSSDFSENMMFTDYATMAQIFGKKKLVTSLKILVSDSEKLASLKTELNKKSVQPEDFEMIEEENQFSEMVESLDMVRQMIFMMIMAVIGAGIIVLSLVLILWVRERMYEIGILLAIGRSKIKIVGQFILELVLVSLPAMILAAILGRIFVGWILGAVLQKESLDSLNLSSFTTGGSELDILLMSYGLLILIMVLAVIAASWMILTKKTERNFSENKLGGKMSVLKIKNVSYAYAGNRENILEGVDQKFERGKFYAIIGKSGAGKSTLLSLLAGLDEPKSGEILFEDEKIGKYGYSYHRKNHIALVFQNYNLIDYLTPLENIRLVNQEATDEILVKLGLDRDQINRNVMKLSGGQQQRVAIARALVSEAPIILADEPTGNLDENTAEEIIDVLKKLAKERNKCVIVVTHSKNVADSADVVLELKGRKLR